MVMVKTGACFDKGFFHLGYMIKIINIQFLSKSNNYITMIVKATTCTSTVLVVRDAAINIASLRIDCDPNPHSNYSLYQISQFT